MGKRSFIILISEAAAGTVFVVLAIIIFARLNVGNVLLYTLVITMGVLRVVQFILYIRMGFGLTNKDKFLNDLAVLIPGGYIECKLDKDLTIKYCNSKLINYLGYEAHEFKAFSKDKMINIIAPEDRERVKAAYNENYGRKKAQLSFSLLCRDGRHMPIVSFVNYGNVFINKIKNIKLAQNFLIDPLPLKQSDMERIEAERYKIVAEQSESIIFDYNISDGTIFLNSNFQKKFGYSIGSEKLEEYAERNGLIHEDDKQKIYNNDYLQNPYREEEIRIKKADGELIWCKVRMSTIYDQAQKPVRIIGKIIDVNDSRKEKQLLIEKTKRDIMTGLYNKTASEALISEELSKAPNDAIYAFMLFDIDNFKQINDQFGHMTGDRVLSKISDSIKMIFRSSDIIGRVGGDEFVIFLKDLPSEEHAVKKAQAVLSIIKQLYNMRENGYTVSASIGLAYFARHGNSYFTLFEKADKALYASKKSGKDTYTVYEPTMNTSNFSKSTEVNG